MRADRCGRRAPLGALPSHRERHRVPRRAVRLAHAPAAPQAALRRRAYGPRPASAPATLDGRSGHSHPDGGRDYTALMESARRILELMFPTAWSAGKFEGSEALAIHRLAADSPLLRELRQTGGIDLAPERRLAQHRP